ncbi:FecCD family ABC transporter permease [Archaeoglobus veneficus]|uniref:ABC-type transporter, integral membrane subunit n=1 Tax=Archaeoglobus veneficus (strain DSM 11195 / SNP6) TaxID=693661 RepID=F2KSW7_ARCVS|nr:iron chelate uptake ABC transporter family permease subunit [Archaeoglobus veneficus]AEA47012.1 ABC-type transporter, integral membrane subunit [Archaeoglobus veneficus SNP6]
MAERTAAVLWLVLLLVVSFIMSVSVGSSSINLSDVFGLLVGGKTSPMAYEIIVNFRLPRTVLAILVGVGLATAGCAMQALFRNPLADPYILGVSSGASVGAAITILLGIASTRNIIIAAFLFAIAAVYIVYRLGRNSVYSLLLAGVAMASFLSGVTSLLIYIAGKDMHQVVFWIMGGFWTANWLKVKVAIFPILFGTAIVAYNSWNLNAILLGEEHAASVGVDVERLRRTIIACSALLTSAAVAVSGVIGFVGLIIPHAMRLVVGEDHRILLPSAILCAASFMPAVDVIARTITSGEIPVGIITAMLGAPFFIYLLRRGGFDT